MWYGCCTSSLLVLLLPLMLWLKGKRASGWWQMTLLQGGSISGRQARLWLPVAALGAH